MGNGSSSAGKTKTASSNPDVIDVIMGRSSSPSKPSNRHQKEQTLADLAWEIFGDDYDEHREIIGRHFGVDLDTPVTAISPQVIVESIAIGKKIIQCRHISRNGERHSITCRCVNCVAGDQTLERDMEEMTKPPNKQMPSQRPASCQASSQTAQPSMIQHDNPQQATNKKVFGVVVIAQMPDVPTDDESDQNATHANKPDEYRKTPKDDDIWDKPEPTLRRPTSKLQAMRLDPNALMRLTQTIRGGAVESSDGSLDRIIEEVEEEVDEDERRDSTTNDGDNRREESGSDDDDFDDLDIDDEREGEIRRIQRQLIDADDHPETWRKHVRVWNSDDMDGGETEETDGSSLTEDYERFLRRNKMQQGLNPEQQKIRSMQSDEPDDDDSEDALFRRPINTNSRYR